MGLRRGSTSDLSERQRSLLREPCGLRQQLAVVLTEKVHYYQAHHEMGETEIADTVEAIMNEVNEREGRQ
jgi:hypothetical protein